ncbi:unnamed protein product, partial [Amoebophrya sp. A120]
KIWGHFDRNTGEVKSGYGLQDLLWMIRNAEAHFIEYPELVDIFGGGRSAGTRIRRMYAYFFAKFPALERDIRIVTREGNAMERAKMGLDLHWEEPALHVAVSNGDKDEVRKILTDVGLFVLRYRDYDEDYEGPHASALDKLDTERFPEIAASLRKLDTEVRAKGVHKLKKKRCKETEMRLLRGVFDECESTGGHLA